HIRWRSLRHLVAVRHCYRRESARHELRCRSRTHHPLSIVTCITISCAVTENKAINHTKDNSLSSSTEQGFDIHPLNKGLGPMDHSLTAHEIPALGWNLLREDLSLPTAVLYEETAAYDAH